MSSIGWMHPQVVHFVVALAFVGVGARLVSLLPLGPRFKFSGPMGAVLIMFAAGASWLATLSGTAAHGPVERVPGSRTAVQEHEEAGELARNLLIGLAVVEIAALVLGGKPKAAKGLQVVSALAGLATLGAVYRAADRGGELVYNYAGGVGLRSGDTTDVRRLLIAGLYHNIGRARDAGQKADAARYVEELVRQMPGDTSVQLMGVESLIRDQNNPRAAIQGLAAIPEPAAGSRFAMRRGMLMADAYTAAGVPDSARTTLEALKQKMAGNPRAVQAVNDALAKLR